MFTYLLNTSTTKFVIQKGITKGFHQISAKLFIRMPIDNCRLFDWLIYALGHVFKNYPVLFLEIKEIAHQQSLGVIFTPFLYEKSTLFA